ncbi:hypothetical protein ACVCAH_26805 [Micromonospora sp. LZ34]
MSGTYLRTFRTLAALALAAGLAAGCEKTAEPESADSASAGPTVDVAANTKTVCTAATEAVKSGFVAMTDDAIAQIDKPIGKQEEDKLIRQRYRTISDGVRQQATQAADPTVRTAFENLAGAIEKRLADPKPMEVDEPELNQPIAGLDTACGN